MTTRGHRHERVLAIDPTNRGFGFVVFEGPERLVDWGVAYVEGDVNAKSLLRIAGLIRRYDPDVLVVEDHTSRTSRRRGRARDLLRQAGHLAGSSQVDLCRVSVPAVRRVFAEIGVSAKYPIAAALAIRYSELAPHLPPRRKPWMNEDPRMGIFDAVAMGLAYYHARQQDRLEA